MPIQSGDRVSVSISPTISLAPYVNLKSHATVSRDVPEGADHKEFLDKLTDDVREVCYNALATELGVMNELSAAIARGDDLTEYLKAKVTNEHPRQTVEAPTPARAGVRRKVRQA